MLLPQSPTNATRLPAMDAPSASSTVKTSHSTCTGCPSSDSALTTGTLAVAISTRRAVRRTCGRRWRRSSAASTRAVSRMGSPRPSWLPCTPSTTGCIPSCAQPTSNDTRVRVLAFSSTIATERAREQLRARCPLGSAFSFVGEREDARAPRRGRGRSSLRKSRFFIAGPAPYVRGGCALPPAALRSALAGRRSSRACLPPRRARALGGAQAICASTDARPRAAEALLRGHRARRLERAQRLRVERGVDGRARGRRRRVAAACLSSTAQRDERARRPCTPRGTARPRRTSASARSVACVKPFVERAAAALGVERHVRQRQRQRRDAPARERPGLQQRQRGPPAGRGCSRWPDPSSARACATTLPTAARALAAHELEDVGVLLLRHHARAGGDRSVERDEPNSLVAKSTTSVADAAEREQRARARPTCSRARSRDRPPCPAR